MPTDQGRIREIAWIELFPWLGLVRAVRLAFAPRMLILAALGLSAMMAGWEVIGVPFRKTENKDVLKAMDDTEHWIDSALPKAPPAVSIKVLDPAESAASVPWNTLSSPFRQLFGKNTDVTSFVYFFLCGVWALLVWSIFGAAITRSAALWFAREDRLGLKRSLAWGVVKWPACFGGAMFPFVGVFFATVVPTLLAWVLMGWDIGLFLAAIAWPLILLCGFVLAILLVGLLFGWPLMWPTISAEGTDSFDALSRSYSYTYQRPVHYLFYAAVAGVLGALAWVVVIIFANGVIDYSFWATSWGASIERVDEIRRSIAGEDFPGKSRAFGWGAGLIGFWVAVVKTLAVGFLFSYFWCATTYIYFLLRQAVDATEMDEVAVEEEPETYGLPPLEVGSGSVPQVDDSSPLSGPSSIENPPEARTPS